MGISQAAGSALQTEASSLVIQHGWSLKGRVSERISGDQKFEECRGVWGVTWRGIQEAEMYENVSVKMYWSTLVSNSNQSYVSHPTQAVPLIIKGRKNNRYCTPHRKNTTHCCHSAPDIIDWWLIDWMTGTSALNFLIALFVVVYFFLLQSIISL